MSDSTVVYQDVPKPKLQAKNLQNWTGLDIFVAVIITLAAVMGWVWGNPILSILVLLITIPLLVRLPHSLGRLYYEIGRGIRGSLWRQIVLKGIWWRIDDTSNRLIRLFRYGIRRQGVIPLRLGEVQAIIGDKLERYALIHATDRPYDYLPVIATGGAFANRDVNQMHRAVQELATITNNVISQAGLKIGVSYLRSSGPFDDTTIARFFRRNSDPVVTRMDLFDLSEDDKARAEWLRNDMLQLVPTARIHGASKMSSVIVLTIKRTREWRKATKGQLSDTALYELPIVELGRSLVEALSNSPVLDMGNVHCMSLPELALFVRTSWDVAEIDQYYAERANGTIPTTSEQVDAIREAYGEVELDRRLKAFPQQCIETPDSDDYIKLDGNYISVLRVTKFPDSIRADQFLALHSIMRRGQWTRQALVGQSVSGETETTALVIGRSALINLEQTFLSGRVIPSPKLLKKNKELARQTDTISANIIAQHFNALWTSIGSNLQEAMKTRKTLQTALEGYGFSVEVIRGHDYQLDAAISGILGANRL